MPLIRKPALTTARSPQEHVDDHDAIHEFVDGHPTDPAAHAGTYERIFGVSPIWGGGLNDASDAIQTQLDAARDAGGGIVVVPGGTFLCVDAGMSITPAHDKVSLRGAGRSATVIKKGADVVLLDMVGAHAATTTTDAVRRINVSDLTLDGGDDDSWTEPLMRAYYTNSCDFRNVDFLSNYGEAIKAVEFWDSYFYGCRFDSVGGTDGTRPAVRFWGGSADEIASGIGHSADNTNNIWMVNCVFESFRDGGLWLTGTGGGALSVNKCNFVNVKLESLFVRGPFVQIERSNFVSFVNLNCTAGAFDSGYSTPADLVQITNSNGVDIDRYVGECVEAAAATVRTFLSVAGNNNQCNFDKLWFSSATTNKPTEAAIEFADENDDQFLGAHAWFFNPGGATLLTGSATTAASQGTFRSDAAQPIQLYGTGEQQIEWRRTDLTNSPRFLLGRVDTTNKRFRLLYEDGVTPEVLCFEVDPITGLLRVAQGMSITDAKNIALGTGTGTKIGTATSQKLGFFNSTPIVQPTASGVNGNSPGLQDLLTELANLGLIVDSTTDAPIPFLQPVVYNTGQDLYYFPQLATATATSAGLGTGTLKLGPCYVPKTLSITKIGAEVTTIGDVGSKVRIGVYADDGNGYPGALLLDAGTINGDSATVQDITLGSPLVLPPGLYWVGGAVQVVTVTQPTVRTVTGFHGAGIPSIPSAGGAACGYVQTGVTGALPATFTATITISGSNARVHWKAQAS